MGKNEWKVRAGEYHIRLTGVNKHRLKLEKNRLTVSRWGTAKTVVTRSITSTSSPFFDPLVTHPPRVENIKTWTVECVAHRGEISALAVSSDESKLASGGQDRTIRIWDLQRRILDFMLVGHETEIADLLWVSSSLLASSDRDGTIRIWDVSARRLVQTHQTSSSFPQLSVSQDGRFLAGSSGRHVISIDLNNGKSSEVLLQSPIEALFWRHAKLYGVTFSGRGADVIQIDSGEVVKHLEGSEQFKNQISTIDVGRESIHLAASFHHGDLRIPVWDLETGKKINEFEQDAVAIRLIGKTHLAISAYSEQHALMVRDINSGNAILDIGGNVHARTIARSPSSSDIFVAPEAGDIFHMRADQQPMQLVKGNGAIRNIVLSSDGSKLAVRRYQEPKGGIYDLHSFTRLNFDSLSKETADENEAFLPACFSNDGKKLVGASNSGIRIWNVENGQIRKHFSTGVKLHGVTASPVAPQIAGHDELGNVFVYDIDDGKRVTESNQSNGAIYQLSWSPTGSHIASAGDKSIQIIDVSTGNTVHQMARIEDTDAYPYRHVTWSTYGKFVISDGHTSLRIWDAKTGELEESVGDANSVGGQISGLFTDENNNVLVFGSPSLPFINQFRLDGNLVLSPASGRIGAILQDPERIRIAATGNTAAIINQNTVRILDVANKQVTSNLVLLRAHKYAFVLPDGSMPGSSRTHSRFRVVAIGTNGQQTTSSVSTPLTERKPITPRASQFPARRVKTGYSEQMHANSLVTHPAKIPGVDSWTIETSQPRGKIHDVSFHPDGDYFACTGSDGSIRLFDTRTGNLRRILVGHDATVKSVSWSPNGKFLLSGSLNRSVIVWDVAKGLPYRRLLDQDEQINAVAWSPTGENFATAGQAGRVAVWDAQEMKMIDILESRKPNPIHEIAFSKDGKQLAAAHNGIELWDVGTPKSKARFWQEERSFRDLNWISNDRFVTLEDNTHAGNPDNPLTNWIVLWDLSIAEKSKVRTNARALARGGGNNIIGIGDESITKYSNSLDSIETQSIDIQAHTIKAARSFDGVHVAWSNQKNRLSVRNLQQGVTTRTIIAHPSMCDTVDCSADGKLLLTAIEQSKNGPQIAIWDTAHGTIKRTVTRKQVAPIAKFGPNALAYAFECNTNIGKRCLRIRSVDSKTDTLFRDFVDDDFKSVCWSKSGDRVAATLYSKIDIYEVQSRSRIERFDRDIRGGKSNIDFSHDGLFLAAAGMEQLCIWNTTSRNVHLEKEISLEHAIVRWAPDKPFVAVSDTRNMIYIFDVPNKRVVQSLDVSAGEANQVRLIHWIDSKTLMTIDSIGEVVSWDVQSGLSNVVRKIDIENPLELDCSDDLSTIVTATPTNAFRVFRTDSHPNPITLVALEHAVNKALKIDSNGRLHGNQRSKDQFVYVIRRNNESVTLSRKEFERQYSGTIAP